MKTAICFYFQVHQPFRLKGDYSFFNIGPDQHYEDENLNREVALKVAKKCYLPANATILSLIKKFRGKFKVSYSISGTALEQFEQYCPEVIDSFKALVKTGCVEILSETYYHSLSVLESTEEFIEQIELHKNKVFDLFGVTPKVFRNTELVYNNKVAEIAEKLGYKAILCEGADRILKFRSPNYLYNAGETSKIKVLLKNYRLSDDIAFRFSSKNWKEYPLTANKYAKWLHEISSSSEIINLFMDYETFGEHQWAESGIFNFLKRLPTQVLKKESFCFMTPSEIVDSFSPAGFIDSPDYISWADEDRTLSAWLGNDMQRSAHSFAYSLEKEVKQTGDKNLIHTWRKLLTSDHSYYVSTKWFNDGAVHSYFSPYKSPHDAFVVYMNVLNDLRLKILQKGVDL